MTRPNILFITADQHRADCLGVEGRRIKTPHLDQLAAEGTRFSNAITPCVVCQPARASILTGQLPRTHGVHDNGIDLDPEIGGRGFAGSLAKAGYDTAYFGKAHFSTYHTFQATGTPECLKSSANYPDSWNGPYMGFDHVELMLVGHNWFPPEKPPAGQAYERFFHADGRGDEKLKLYWENAGDTKGAAQTWHSKLPLAWHNSPWTADRAIDWLQSLDTDDDWFLWLSFPDPHHPWDPPASEVERLDWRDLDLPPGYAGSPEACAEVLAGKPRHWLDWYEGRNQFAFEVPPDFRPCDLTPDQIREVNALTHIENELIDDACGRVMAAIDQKGWGDWTDVLFTTDHGE